MSVLVDSILAAARGTRWALTVGTVAEPHHIPWSEVHRAAAGMSTALADKGIGHGDTVAVLAGDAADVAPLAQALWIRGAALTMLQQPTPRMDLGVWLADTLRALEMLRVAGVVVGVPFEMAAPPLAEQGLPVWSVDSLREAGPIALVQADEADIALRQLTSGSTGIPKAVEISHGNLAANIDSTGRATGATSDSIAVSWLPLCHDMGMIGFICMPMVYGAQAVVLRTEEFLRRPIVWAEMITRFGATITAGPNFAYSVLARMLERCEPPTIDLSSLRVAINGAEPIDHRDLEHFQSVGARFGLGPGVLTPFYGLAEATVTVSAGVFGVPPVVDHVSRARMAAADVAEPVAPDSPDGQPVVCVGRPVHDMRVRVTKDGNILGSREIGAIEVAGPSVARSYLTTDGTVMLADEDGWVDTGDLGYLDEQDRLYICGRSKDLIVLAGRNLYPHDIERAAAGVEGVRKGCVVALRIDTDREGFAVLAEVYDRYGEQDRMRLRREIAARVSSHVGHVPREVKLLTPGSLPKTTSGKLRRSHARALLG
ncbi:MULTISPECIES: fatty acyl-AMP ligase [Mycobacterium]|uniref:Ligase n=1 Tax=Mycobacterium kiyosense TaxID=2871094 RepID=A0A9P3UYW4_9MYCO|nr:MULTISPECIES: fatty acyl-AMP ligase [Mycobacterium]BDB45678.1 putative ligase [Mycobacterium kiyosense]BDE11293.1 putative ligase [Mycobacterium sp. 20KCMC460]GLB84587.1 putative ligase [Mycobacterium kiyosense]GLB91621.1 putative ligase [Mycobacterium kiyosense]GLB96899.1 putative ligase [Mycobacterium kiyosense]